MALLLVTSYGTVVTRLGAERNVLFFSMLARLVASRSLLAPKLLVLSLPVLGGARGLGLQRPVKGGPRARGSYTTIVNCRLPGTSRLSLCLWFTRCLVVGFSSPLCDPCEHKYAWVIKHESDFSTKRSSLRIAGSLGAFS